MDNLPREIINKIMLFTSLPVAEIFKNAMGIARIQMEEDMELNIKCDCCNINSFQILNISFLFLAIHFSYFQVNKIEDQILIIKTYFHCLMIELCTYF